MEAELPIALRLRIDRQCDRFEREWLANERPSMEPFLEGWQGAELEALFQSLLEIDIDYRQRIGDTWEAEDYLRHYGHLAVTIRRYFAGASTPTVAVSPSLRPDERPRRLFLPGEIFAKRYRIVALLGEGGMGEVYRGEDTRLGHTVALKFLSDSQSSRRRLDYFLREVRLSQRLGHPNICRVHDLVEADGFCCLSMEYIEGEDLRTLLRRVGQLSENKALQLAHEICHGLAAAHNAGILHRDLKPANIMVDERGRARITDFGLAREWHQRGTDELLVGTPAYMSPEQLERNETSVQSDLYALGLLLLEMLTGQRAHRATSVEDIAQMHQEEAALNLVRDCTHLAPTITEAISACLANQPKDRPRSARSVASRLPGSTFSELYTPDETPSPGMVAAAGPPGTLGPKQRCALVASISILLTIVLFLSSSAFSRFGRIEPPALLVDRVASTLDEFGIPRGSYRAFGYEADRERLRWRANTGRLASPPESPKSGVYFWFRESSTPLVALVPDWKGDRFLSVDELRPPNGPGMTHVRLDGTGALTYLEVAVDASFQANGGTLDDSVWVKLLQRAGFSDEEIATRQPVEAHFVPVGFAEERRSWKLRRGIGDDSLEFRVDVARCGSIPCHFRVVGPWNDSAAPGEPSHGMTAGSWRLTAILVIWIPCLIAFGAFLARRNLNSKRAHREAANRLALFGAGMVLLMWLLGGDHVFAPLQVDLLVTALAGAALMAAVVWCAYVAFEPYMRRLWPRTLTSWNRLLEGQWANPLIGRDLALGVLAGTFAAFGKLLIVEAPRYFGIATYGLPNIYNFAPLDGLRAAFAEISGALVLAMIYSLFFQLLFLMALKLLLRSTKIASVLFVLFLSCMVSIQYSPSAWAFAVTMVEMSLTAYIYLRIGLLSAVAMHFTRLLLKWPLTVDFSLWYAEKGQLVLLVIAAIVTWCVYVTAVQGRRSAAVWPTESVSES